MTDVSTHLVTVGHLETLSHLLRRPLSHQLGTYFSVQSGESWTNFNTLLVV